MWRRILKKKGSNIIFPVILRLLGRTTFVEKGKEMEINILKDRGGEDYQVVGNIIHPCVEVSDSEELLARSAQHFSRNQRHSAEVIFFIRSREKLFPYKYGILVPILNK